jgi:hypothetical protein
MPAMFRSARFGILIAIIGAPIEEPLEVGRPE